MNKTILSVFTIFLLCSCGKEQSPSGPKYQDGPKSDIAKTYYFASHPLYNPTKLQQAYQPLIDHLNKNIPEAHFALEGSVDYQAYEAKIRAAKPEFLLPNPWQTILAFKHGYHVIAEAGDSADFKGIFIVRKDSTIKNFADLKGKTVSYPSPTALAACIMPQYLMHQNGINVTRDITNKYVGSQESSIMNAYLKESDIAATWPPPWRLFQKDHPNEAAELQLIWETPSLINNSVMVRQDVPDTIGNKVKELLLGLKNTSEGQAILKASETAAFNPADDKTYEKVSTYVATFENEVRPVEQK